MNENWSQHQETLIAVENPESLRKGWLMESSNIWNNMELLKCNKVELQPPIPPWLSLNVEFIIEESILNTTWIVA